MSVFYSKAKSQMTAVEAAQAILELDLDGKITAANSRFLSVMGYGLEELLGRHHSLLVDHAERESPAYARFWEALRRGEPSRASSGASARAGARSGSRRPTARSRTGPASPAASSPPSPTSPIGRSARSRARRRSRPSTSQGIMAFDLDGTVVDANENALAMLGYDREEVLGKHHGMFVEPDDRGSSAIARSGRPCGGASTRRPSSGASARTAARSGSRPATRPSATPPAG